MARETTRLPEPLATDIEDKNVFSYMQKLLKALRLNFDTLDSGVAESLAAVNSIDLNADAIDDSTTTNKFVTATDLTNLANLSGTNSGDQTASTVSADNTGNVILTGITVQDQLDAVETQLNTDNGANDLLRLDSSGKVPTANLSGIVISKQVFTSSGTYTKPSNLLYAEVIVQAGGAGGYSSGGGSAGGVSLKLIAAASIGSTETVTVGTAVSAATAGNSSSFGSHCSATGGTTNTPYSLGGIGSNGDINLRGGGGYGYIGGASYFGGGGTGSNAGAYGAGGGGTNGPGNAGIVVVTEYKSA